MKDLFCLTVFGVFFLKLVDRITFGPLVWQTIMAGEHCRARCSLHGCWEAEREEEDELACQYPFAGMPSKTGSPPTRPYLLKIPSPPKTVLKDLDFNTKLLTHDLGGGTYPNYSILPLAPKVSHSSHKCKNLFRLEAWLKW